MKTRASKFKLFSYPAFLIVFILLNLLGIGLVMNWVWNLLERYETSTPANVIKGVVSQLDEDAVGFLSSHSDFAPGEFSTQEQFEEYLSAKLGEGPYTFGYTALSSEDENDLHYNLLCNDKKIAAVEIIRQPPEGGRGLVQWKLGPVTKLYQYQLPLTVLAPEGAQVEVNGVLLEQRHEGERAKVPEGFIGLPESIQPPQLVGYQVEGLLTVPQVTATGADGQTCVVEQRGSEAVVSVSATQQQIDKWEPLAREVATLYARFITKDAQSSDLNPLMLPGGALAKQVANFYNGWYIPHDSYAVKDVQTGEFLTYGENYFSCEISFLYTIYKGNKNYDYPSAYTVYGVKTSSGWKVANLAVS